MATVLLRHVQKFVSHDLKHKLQKEVRYQGEI